MIRDGGDGIAQVSCRIIEVLGDEFDFMAFNSQFRVDQQETGPAHGFGGYYWGNIRAEVEGIGIREDDTTTPCESRLKNTWGYPVWMKARTVVHESHAELPGQTPYDWALMFFRARDRPYLACLRRIHEEWRAEIAARRVWPLDARAACTRAVPPVGNRERVGHGRGSTGASTAMGPSRPRPG